MYQSAVAQAQHQPAARPPRAPSSSPLLQHRASSFPVLSSVCTYRIVSVHSAVEIKRCNEGGAPEELFTIRLVKLAKNERDSVFEARNDNVLDGIDTPVCRADDFVQRGEGRLQRCELNKSLDSLRVYLFRSQNLLATTTETRQIEICAMCQVLRARSCLTAHLFPVAGRPRTQAV